MDFRSESGRNQVKIGSKSEPGGGAWRGQAQRGGSGWNGLSGSLGHGERAWGHGLGSAVTLSSLLKNGIGLPNGFCGKVPSWHGRFATRFAQIDSRESFAIQTPSIFIARQAGSPESLEFPLRANRELCESIRANHATK